MQYLKKQHDLGFWVYFLLLDLDKIFKKRDKNWNAKHDRCVYVWVKDSVIYYIGQGWFREIDWQNGRPFHLDCNDMLTNTIDESWTCVILSWGLTMFEARLWESKLIDLYEGDLSKPGAYVWDGKSLMNKKRERSYKGIVFETVYDDYLNLEDGNNYWETFRRKINGNQGRPVPSN